MMTENPLLDWTSYPDFSAIKPEHIAPAVDWLVSWGESEVAALEAAQPASFEALIRPLERIIDARSRLGSLLRHLFQVVDIPGWKDAYNEALPKIISMGTRIDQSPALYAAMKSITPADEAERRILSSRILDAELAGVALEADERAAFLAAEQELGSLMTQFTANVLEKQKTWSYTITDPAAVAGLPASWRALTAQRARDSGEDGATAEAGPWCIALDYGSISPVLSHSTDRALRERCRRELSRSGAGTNLPILKRILELRAEQSARLGFDSYLSLSLADKMAPSLQHIEALLEQLTLASTEPALKEAAELESLAAASGHPTPLQAWDRGFWAERLREQRFGLRDEELRPYFPLAQVLKALFFRAESLFGVRIEADDGAVSVWHEDVRFFRIFRGEEQIASFYLDSYARPGTKRGGAWMNGFVGRSSALAQPGEDSRLPVAVLVCNQTPPVDDIPSLMTFRNVETLFHEFGHGLHHMLTQVSESLVSGISGVEWDAVELPSMWMEGWCTHRPTLRMMARHYETGEPMPDALLEQLLAAGTFRAATLLRAQLGWATMDLRLHGGPPPADPIALQHEVLSACWLSPTLPDDRWICSFNHVFGGSAYAAAYYSYLWAEVLATDAYAAFSALDPDDAEGLTAVGQRFWTEVLSVGGSRHPMENFAAFRGREPSTDALLRTKGLLTEQ